MASKRVVLAAGLACVPYLCALAYACIVGWHGIPALRHDWAWPANEQALADFWLRSTSGWNQAGIGSPTLHLNDYLPGAALFLAAKILGVYGALLALAFCVGLACALGGKSIAERAGGGGLAAAGVALFALFNPFVYIETIAGHIYLVLAYGAVLALVGEALRPKPRAVAMSLLVALTSAQLQYFVPAALLAIVIGFRRRTWLPLATGIIVALPVIAMVLSEQSALQGIPVSLTWETIQSTSLAQVFSLDHYFAGYGQAVHWLDQWPMFTIVALAVAGYLVAWRTVRARLGLAVLFVSALAVAGTSGPFGPALSWMFVHAPGTALYRELYDVAGILAISYALGVALLAARYRFARVPAALAGLTMVAVFLMHSPWSWWVPAASLPRLTITPQTPGSRYALLPAFQPLTFKGRGSGVDPDAYIRSGMPPLNTETPAYPVDAALARYSLHGDARSLAALGVGLIIGRPWFESDRIAVSFQRALRSAPQPATPYGSERLNAQALVAILPLPTVGSVDDELGAGAIFFADASGLSGDLVPQSWSRFRPLVTVVPPLHLLDASQGWVDARLAFASDPQLAQAFGGAVTTSPRDLLSLRRGVPALAWVRGLLLAKDGRRLAVTTHAYQWVDIPQTVNAVRCEGLCVVAAQGFPPSNTPANPARAQPVGISFQRPLPWFLKVQLPDGDVGTLRFNEQYDRNWLAWDGDKLLTHVRLDATVNGWLLPARRSVTTVALVEWPAAVEAGLELIGGIWVLGLVALLLRRIGK